MVIEYSDRVNNPASPTGGLCIKTFYGWSFEKIRPAVMFKLRQNEQIVVQPGAQIAIGSLQFIVERYNIGIVAKIGNRTHMEDSNIIVHDIGLDGALKASYFSIIDGHGGDWCA
jgi:hypothetical protein